MNYIIILLSLAEPIYVPFDKTLSCYEQGKEVIETIATYHEQSDDQDQGWYTFKGKLVYGFYCDIE